MPKIARPANERLASVNLIEKDGHYEAEVCFMPDPDSLISEGVSRAFFALDGSKSMKGSYGSDLFSTIPNVVEPLAQGLGKDLAGYFSEPISLLYWAVGVGGQEIEEIGDIAQEQFDSLDIGGPSKRWGTGTKLMPALKYVTEYGAKGSTFALGVFFTDGFIEDEKEVREYCYSFGEKLVGEGAADWFKLVIIGVGEEVDREQLIRLDDMFEGTPLEGKIDLWSSGVYSDWREVWHARGVLFGESNNQTIPGSARVVDDQGNELARYPDNVPGKIRFDVPADAAEFVIKLQGDVEIRQPLKGAGVTLVP